MVARSAIISDRLLKDLMAAGQADVVVGMATFNHAGTVSRVLDAVLEAFTTTLLRERTVLVAADGGSGDGTVEMVRGTSPADANRPFRHPLRTVHRIAGAYSGIPSAKSALRMLLAAAELLHARSLILVDPADVALTASEITAFAHATFKDKYDLVAPVLPRAPADGPLVTQLVRPVIRALWGRRIAEPLAMPLGFSGRLAVDVGRQTPWVALAGRLAGELWAVSQGLGAGWRVGQIPILERPRGSTRRGGLVEIFSDIVTTLFEFAARVPPDCIAREASEDVPVLGTAPGWLAHEVRVDADAEGAAFRSARSLLEPLWSKILSPDTLARVLAESDNPAGRLEDELWARTTYEFLLARHHAVMPQGQLARALLPLYQGRVAAFLNSLRGADSARASMKLEALAVEFERQKPAWRSALGSTPR